MSEVSELKKKLKAAASATEKAQAALEKVKVESKEKINRLTLDNNKAINDANAATKEAVAKAQADVKAVATESEKKTKAAIEEADAKMKKIIAEKTKEFEDQSDEIQKLVAESRKNANEPVSIEEALYIKLCHKHGSFSKSKKERKWVPASLKKLAAIAIEDGLEMDLKDIAADDIIEHYYGG